MIAQEQEPRNFRNPDPLNCSLEGRAVTVSLLNGRIESGKVKVMGQYSMMLELPLYILFGPIWQIFTHTV